MDTLVLGCTHYVFAEPLLRELAGPGIRIIETGAAVARQAKRLLQERALLIDPGTRPHGGDVELYTSAAPTALQAAAQRWLSFPISRCATVSLP